MDVEGKLLLRCAERDAKHASSDISRGEMRESHVSLETPLSEEIATLEVGGHTEPRVGMMNCLAHGEVRAPCRWTGAMQMLKEAPCRWAGAMLVLKTRGAVISEFSHAQRAWRERAGVMG